ncbi:MAG TPA: HNH endonuclease signature motif containing protein, partial [Acidimicrobiales bacterium]|nr:HNH endonuclease signature motif containing protein [Acidimicrobiales bacterium]
RVQHVRVDDADRPIGIGYVSQIVPPWLRRLVRRRDRGCRFPGCGRTRFTQPHHMWWWSDGGPTNIDNLVSLCNAHHRLLHEGRWRVRGNPDTDDGLEWIRPDGSILRTGPPPLHDEILTRLQQLKRAG